MLELETQRLLLRQLCEADLDAYAEFAGDEETMRFLGGTVGRQDAWRQMAMLLGHWQLRGFGMWAVVDKSSNQFLGRIGLHFPEGWPEIEVGWMLGRPYWGNGYALEAAAASARYGFETLGLQRLISFCAPDNQRSIRVAERLGEVAECTTEIRGIEVIQLGMSREDFERAQGDLPS